MVDIGPSEQGIQGVRSAAAPPPDPHSGQIDVGEGPAKLPDSRRMLLRRLHADCRKGRPPPRRALGRRCAPILDGHDQVPEIRDGAMVVVPGRPPVQDGLAVRFPVDVDEHRVSAGRIEVPRLDQPRIHDHPVPDIQLQELGGVGDRGLGPAPDLLVVLQDPNDTVLREADQFGYRGGVEGGVRVKGPPKVGREVMEVGPRLVFGSDSLGLFGAIQPDPVEVPLLWRCRARRSNRTSPPFHRPVPAP